MGVEKTRLDVLRLKDGILTEYGLDAIARSQHFQHMFDRETHAADNWLAAENVGAEGDAIKQINFLIHGFVLL